MRGKHATHFEYTPSAFFITWHRAGPTDQEILSAAMLARGVIAALLTLLRRADVTTRPQER